MASPFSFFRKYSAGMMVVLVEAVSRRAWVRVHWGKGEESVLTLGKDPILVGYSPRAHVRPTARGHGPEEVARISFDGASIHVQDVASKRTRSMYDGDEELFGEVTLEFRAAA